MLLSQLHPTLKPRMHEQLAFTQERQSSNEEEEVE